MRAMLTLVRRAYRSYGADGCGTHAAAIAYYTVFAIFPIALLSVAVLSFFLGTTTAREHVVQAVVSIIALGPDSRQTIERTLEQLNRTRGVLSVVGLFTGLWSAKVLFSAIRAALDAVWGIDQSAPFLRARLADLWLFVGFGSLLLAPSLASQALIWARGVGANWFGPLHGGSLVAFVALLLAVSLTLTFLAFVFLHRFGTRARVGWGDVWPAALLTTVFFEAGKFAFGFYIRSIGNLNALVGSLGAAILLLVFVNYTARVTLMSAEIAKHRKLIRSGLLPRTAVREPAADLSLQERVREALVRLWNADPGAGDDAPTAARMAGAPPRAKR